MSLGIYVTLLMGKDTLEPASVLLMNSLQSVSVTTSDKDQNGFQLTFLAGRCGVDDMDDYPLLKEKAINLFNRVRILVSFGAASKVLIDGIITHHQLNPSKEAGKTTLTITGKDLSVMMDLEEKIKSFESRSEDSIVEEIIKEYSSLGLKAKIIKHDNMQAASPDNIIRSQRTTDLKYIRQLATKFGYVFYIENTDDDPQNNIAYFGPTNWEEVEKQKALSFNMGEFTNLNSINFSLDALQQGNIEGKTQNTENGSIEDTPKVKSSREKLALQSISDLCSDIKIVKLPQKSGASQTDVTTMAQKEADNASSDAVTATGEIDSLQYKDVLKARHLVALRGVGHLYNGLYYVKTVTHKLEKGSYKQSFTLSREGLGSTIEEVKKL
ncbi:MAG: hypothetical protein FWF27_06475 [Candidatus Bathyarchaeota archaeon]|nr:hypothetical protein [Candidatus Termiticorpusculum sp.]